jgi:tetratricopeptide (TPR) repeat protein
MKKETFAEKLARKSFESAAVQKSWQVHTQVFGPILEPAFVDNFTARVHLTNALNHISRCDSEKGIQKLRLIEKDCVSDADKAAWLFCMGLCMEMAGMKEEMVSFYQKAGKYGHCFYLPYLKVAKAAHNDAVFEVAEENYKEAVRCLKETGAVGQNQLILGSVYTNYASCLTMMHRYEEAENALQSSREILPVLQGRAASEAILAAAKSETEKALGILAEIKVSEPAVFAMADKMVNEILDNKHPHFSPVNMADGWESAFWTWFVENEEKFLKNLEMEEYSSVFFAIQPKLNEIFPFVKRDLEIAVDKRENGYCLTFADFFMVSLAEAYRDLINAAPSSLAERWCFETVH